jgi:hypothetical protein
MKLDLGEVQDANGESLLETFEKVLLAADHSKGLSI